MSKVLVLGAGSQVVSVAAALAMADAACDVVFVDEYVIRERIERFEPPVLAAWSPGSFRDDGWYQQFAGRCGKPPRY